MSATTMPSDDDALVQLRQQFFDAYLEHHPEEASTLGVSTGAGRLRDHRPEALAHERRWMSEVEASLAQIDRSRLTPDNQLDHQSMTALVSHHLRAWDHLWCAVDWSMYPYTMVMAEEVHVRTEPERVTLRQRIDAIPEFLAQHQANVERAIAAGIPPDAALTSFFAEHQIPPASRFLRTHLDAPHAAAAYDAHGAWLREVALEHAAEALAVGEAEVSWQLRHTLGISTPPAALIQRGREELARVQADLVACAAGIDPTVRDFAGVRALADTMQQQTIASDAEVVPLYRAFLERAHALVLEQGLFAVPADYAIGVEPLPPGFTAASHAGNWPAPLLNRNRLGQFMVDPRGSAHRVAWAADLAVHEGMPGHHLQSFWWQQRFHGHSSPVRFLLVHDQVAIPRHFWGPMLNIEGYAVYAEELMRQAGFFTREEEMFVLLAHCVRAARVVVDLSLHTGAITPEEGEALLIHEVCLPASAAQLEVRRYRQCALQASTYLLGRLAIEDLATEARAREGGAFDLARFHDRFFAYGPVAPMLIHEHMFGAAESNGSDVRG